MLKLHHELALLDESLDEDGIFGQVRQDPLNHHVLLEARRAGRSSAKHLSHSTDTQAGEQLISANMT